MFSQIATVGTAVATGGTNPAVDVAAVSSITSLFSNQDSARQQRVDWTLAQANLQSVTAAEIIIAAPDYTAGNEDPMWQAALGKVRNDVLTRAYATAPNGWWPDGLPDFFTDVNGATHQRILAEVRAADIASQVSGTPPAVYGGPVVAGGGGTVPAPYVGAPAQMLPTVKVTATAPTPTTSTSKIALIVVVVVVVLIGLYFTLRR